MIRLGGEAEGKYVPCALHSASGAEVGGMVAVVEQVGLFLQ